jgi:hypothetical protein
MFYKIEPGFVSRSSSSCGEGYKRFTRVAYDRKNNLARFVR